MQIKMRNQTAEEINLSIMSVASNYNRWIFNKLRPYLGRRILEVGGGVGNMTGLFLKRADTLVTTEINPHNINILKKRFLGSNVIVSDCDISKGNAKFVGMFDTAVCINVLEHVERDLDLLKNLKTSLEDKGHLALVVPAFNRLYGTIDKSDNHFRRYDRKQILKLVNEAGFKPVKCFFMNMPGFFGWYYHGRILRLNTHTENDISLFDKLTPPFGLSLVVIAKK